jgi:TonB-linked SusC/RagA family outer membrane protein
VFNLKIEFMKRKLTMFLALFFVGIGLAVAQTQVRGTVVDEAGEPMVGATVQIKGTAQGTITDVDGTFMISAPSDGILVISYVGMETQEVKVMSTVKVILKGNSQVLDEVIVVAYGTTRRSSFAGAASTIKGEKLEKIQTSNLSKALEGTTAGLQTTSGSGQPGAGASIIIRGLGSISASQSPLIVLDGVPYEGSLNSIPPQDIESYTVLKDAAANSLYGARGSNGVIIITTKKGKGGKTNVNFDMRAGYNSRGIPTYDMIDDPGIFYEMYWEALRNKEIFNGSPYMTANTTASKNLINNLKYNVFKDVPDEQLIDPATGKLNPAAITRKWNDDWLKQPFENGMRQEYNVNISQGNESSNVYTSLSYLSDEGYAVNSNFERLSARINAEQKIGNHFKMNGSLNYANTVLSNITSSGTSNYSNIFFFGQAIAPIYPIYLYDKNTSEPVLDNNGKRRYDFGTEYARPYASEQNPLAVLHANINKAVVDVFTARGSAEYKFLNDFKVTVNAAYDVFSSVAVEFATPIGGDAANVGGRGEKQTSRYSALNINQLLNYDKTVGNHTINVLLGHETKFDTSNDLYGHMTNFVDPTNPEFSNAARYQDLTSSEQKYSLEGYFGKLDYNYNEKYYLTASLRTDGSSRFHPDHRWGQFWALGGSWRISNEDFMSNIDFINDLKLKVSYGTQGNDNIGTWYAYRNLYSISRIDGEPSTALSFRGNPELTWEKSANFNAGFELKAVDNRLSIVSDFFIKETKDLLYAKPLAVSEGLPSSIYVNDIDMKNTGIEFEVGYDIIKNRNLTWNVNFNATHYKNALTRLPSDKAELISKEGGYQAVGYWREIGGSIYEYFTYEYAGVNEKNGRALYNVYEQIKDENGVVTGYEKKDPTEETSSATLMKTGKSPIPDVYGGVSTSLDFKGFDLFAQTAFQLGGYVSDGVYQNFMNSGSSGANFHKDMYKRWTPENTKTDIPYLIYEDQNQAASSDRWLTSASYFSIRNITLGYTLPKRLVQGLKIEKLRVYGVADNVFYVSKRKGLDVRQSFSGAVGYTYSPIRTISLGVQLSF